MAGVARAARPPGLTRAALGALRVGRVGQPSGLADHAYFAAVAERLGGKRPVLSVARKLARRCHHTLRALGDAAWAPPSMPVAEAA